MNKMGYEELTPEKLDKIRNVLVNEIYRNPTIILNDSIRGNDICNDIDLLEVITDLYEWLHMLVKHESYDYMFHWANKAGGWVETGNFNEIVKEYTDEER